MAEGNGDGLEITRVFAAPREAVWREWTDPEAFADWFGGPEIEVPLESVAMDVRPGGAWRLTMLSGPEDEIHWEGEYREVDPPERLVFTITDEPGNPERDVITVVLAELDGERTEMRMSQTGGHMPPESYERAKQGWGVFFDRMAARLDEAQT